MSGSVIAIAFMLAGFQAPVSVDTGFLDRSITLNGETYRYQVYIPAEWTPKLTWPITVYLHGNGQQGTDGTRHTATGIADAIRRDKSLFPMVVVMPQAQPGTRWSTAKMQEMVLAIIDRTTEEFRGDPDRVYLTGFSMGAQGATRIAARFPGRFAGLVAIAGRIHPKATNETKEQADEDVRTHVFLDPDPYAGTAKRIGAVPIAVFHGGADKVVPVEESRRLTAALKAAGGSVLYTEFVEEDHEASARKALSDRQLWSWLLLQQRNKPSRSLTESTDGASIIQFDTKGVEFGPWIREFAAAVKRNWFVPKAAASLRGRVVITFRVLKDGTITDVAVAESSLVELNEPAQRAVLDSNPVKPLPSEYPDPSAVFRVSFHYNPPPQ